MKVDVSELIGWYGVVAIILAYGLLSFGYFQADNIFFQVLNFTGAIGIIIDAYQDKNYQPVVLNIIWAGIALLTLAKLFF